MRVFSDCSISGKPPSGFHQHLGITGEQCQVQTNWLKEIMIIHTRKGIVWSVFFTMLFHDCCASILSESLASLVDGYSTEGPLASLRHHEPAEHWDCVHWNTRVNKGQSDDALTDTPTATLDHIATADESICSKNLHIQLDPLFAFKISSHYNYKVLQLMEDHLKCPHSPNSSEN